MKIIKLLLLSLIVLSCSKDDDSSDKSSSNLFNPPEWIQGTWKNEIDPTSYISYKFTNDNVIQTTVFASVNSTVDYKMTYSNDLTNVTEEITDNNYAYTIATKTSSSTSEVTIQFKKISDTQIQPILSGQGGLLFEKQP